MKKGKSFTKVIKEKETILEYAISYWKYIFTFCILQFLDMVLTEKSIQWTPFLTIEMIVFGVIGFALVIIYLYYFIHCKFKNREVQYANVLKDYFIDETLLEYANFGTIWKHVVTLMQHSEMSNVRKEESVFWGWGDDGILAICEDKGTVEAYKNGFSLKVRPWTCTEQKNVNLIVRTPIMDEKLTVNRLREQFDVCMKKEKITYANQLYMYPLFLNEDGKAIRLKESIIQPLLLTHELLNEENEIGNIALQKCLEQMQRLAGNTDEQWKPMRYGIVSLFQQMQVEDGEIPKIGMLTFIQIDNEVVNWLDNHKLIETYFGTETEVVNAMLDESQDEIFQYSLLIYNYAKLKRYEFVELFLKKFSKIRKNVKRNVRAKTEKENIYAGTAKESLKSKCMLCLRRLIYNLSEFIVNSPWKKILFLIVFALENVIEPFTVGSANVSLNGQSIWQALVLDNVETILLIAFVTIAWLILLFVFNCERVKKFLNPSEKMLQPLISDEQNKYIQIGKNINLFWAEDLVKGWKDDKISICVSKPDFKATKELLNFANEKIKREKNNGTKFRMINVSEDTENEKIKIIVDRCKYTETMCVQEMLKSYRETNANAEYYNCMREALINLKVRREEIRPEKIPPNSLCMHAVIVTKDDYVLLTKRSENLSYYPGAYDCSAEEQLHKDDFDQDGVHISNWVERFLEEELGLTKDNCGSSTIGKVNLLSIFIEEDALNVALAVKIRLNTSKTQLEAILNNWPRKDYEFKYQLVNWEALVEQFEIVQKAKGVKQFHPTAVNRMYLAACSEMRFDLAERILKVATSS